MAHRWPACPGGNQFLLVDLHIRRGFNAESDLIPVDLDDRQDDVVSDKNLLTDFPAEDKHFVDSATIRSVWCPYHGVHSKAELHTVYFNY